MANNVGGQQLWLTGSRVYFIRDPVNGVEQPPIDLGRIEPVSPAITPQIITLDDSDGGMKRRIAEEVVGIEESYEVRFSNLNLNNRALLLAANPASAFTQATTSVTATHWCVPGSLVKLRDASGVFVYGVASITSVGGTLVQGTDWEVVSLERGLIRMITGGAHVTAGNLSIVYVPRAITGNRLLTPQTAGSVQGTAIIVWGRTNNQFQSARECRVSMAPTGAAFGVDAYSTGTVRMTVLGDLSQPIPAGRMIDWLGALPNVS